jgi:hypothetical protein
MAPKIESMLPSHPQRKTLKDSRRRYPTYQKMSEENEIMFYGRKD